MLFLVLVSACLRAPPPATAAPALQRPPTPALVRMEQPLVEGALAFADELRPLQDAVATYLEGQGFTVVSLAEQAEIIDAAQRGERYLSGERCAVPYIADELLDHRHPAADRVDIRAECAEDDGCRLEVTRTSAPAAAQYATLERWVAPLPAAFTLEDAVSAAARLTPLPLETESGGVIGGRGGRASTQREVQIEELRADGWSQAEAQAALSALDLDRCWRDDQRDHWVNPILFELDAAGTVTRCESRYASRLPESENDCGCTVLRAARLGPGAPGRRAMLDLYSTQPELRDASGRYLWVSVGRPESSTLGLDWAGSGLGGHRMAACLEQPPPEPKSPLTVTYQVDRTGAPQERTVTWPTWLRESERACMDALLDEARFGCPLEPADAEVTVKLVIGTSQR